MSADVEMSTDVERATVRLSAVRLGPYSIRVTPRAMLACGVVLVVLLVVSVLTMGAGRLGLSPVETLLAAFGQGEPAAVRSVQGRRLPRLLTAIGVGGCLGASGAVFQSLARNALASPDIIGFTSGAAAGAVVQILFFGGGVLDTALSAIAGGIVTALVVYVLSRKGGVSGGMRLVLVGIGIGAVLSAVTDFLIVRAEITDAATVQLWSAGSLTGRGWPHAGSVFAAAAILMPLLAVVGRRVTLMEMGDDVAAGLGIPVERYRLAAMVLGVLLVGVAIAAAGPIAFVALAAPQIARRIARGSGVPLATSFVVGAVLLTGADLVAQTVDIGLRTPVGLVTSLLGGAYLVWLLARRA